MHFLLYENHIISYDTHVITSYASHMTAFLYKSFHVKFIFILYDNYVWRNWLCTRTMLISDYDSSSALLTFIFAPKHRRLHVPTIYDLSKNKKNIN